MVFYFIIRRRREIIAALSINIYIFFVIKWESTFDIFIPNHTVRYINTCFAKKLKKKCRK